MKTPDRLTDNIFYISGEINNRLAQKINQAFRENGIDITIEQFSILALLWYREGYNQTEIAAALNRDKTTITRVLGNMFNKNLLVKVPNGIDNRSNLVYLTKKGKDLQQDCIRITGEFYLRGLNDIAENELETSLDVLNRIFRNLQ